MVTFQGCPSKSPLKGRLLESARHEVFILCGINFQRRRLENDWPPNPLKGGFLDCTENDFFCAWQTFQRRRLENVSFGWRCSFIETLPPAGGQVPV